MKKDNKAIVITSIIAGVILIIALTALANNAALPGSKNTVTVEGTATIDAEPDLISVYFNIETLGNTSAEARDANNEIMDDLVTELAKAGFSRDNLKTQNFNVYPNTYWDSDERKEEQDGYKAVHSLKIELSEDDFDQVSEVVDAGIDAGTGISYINFELSPESQNEYKAQALELASKDAKTKAEAVASGFEQKLGGLVSVQVSNFGYNPWRVYAAEGSASSDDALAAQEAATNISPDEQQINARVSATYKLR